mmetsp:Transcript_101362/g.282120  ORF Transcript_101362/g.282120 Transcript_101362/m.282120 type:complete len:215 (+) Transcript_101362:270-914(+)
MSKYSASCSKATSLVNRMSPANGPFAPLTLHCQWPPGPMCFSQVLFTRTLKNSLSHLVGLVVQGPSKPAVKVSAPLPVPHWPGHGSVTFSSGDGPGPNGHAPCDLPNACPPPMRATVSLSFMPMRPKASRMSTELLAGSGSGAHWPSGPFTTGPSGLRYMSPTVVLPSGRVHLPLTSQGANRSCCGLGPRSRLSVPSGESKRPAQYSLTGPPML